MPKKPPVVDERSPEQQWLAAQRETLIKIHEFESMSELLKKKEDRCRLIVEGYCVVIAAHIERLLRLDINDPVLETELKELHSSRRYKAYWEGVHRTAQGVRAQNYETAQTLRRLLASAPYPGEGPLIDSPPLPEGMEGNAGSSSRTEGEGAHVVRPEAAPQAG